MLQVNDKNVDEFVFYHGKINCCYNAVEGGLVIAPNQRNRMSIRIQDLTQLDNMIQVLKQVRNQMSCVLKNEEYTHER